MGLKLSNNALSRLAAGISNTATTINLVAGDGALFPSLSSGEWFPATLFSNGGVEIVKVTGRSADALTVVRGQEGTNAIPFLANDHIEVRLTAAALSEMILPPGTGPLPWSLLTEPTGWIFCDGRTLLSSTSFGALRAAYIAASFPFGQDGSGNPFVPDMRGRVPAGRDNMGGTPAYRITTGRAEIDGNILGAAGGWEGHTISVNELPAHSHAVTDPTHAHSVSDPTHAHGVYDPGHAHGYDRYSTGGVGFAAGTATRQNVASTTGAAGTGIGIYGAATGIAIYGAGTGVSIQNTGLGYEHSIVQPTLMTNYIVKT